MFFAFVPFTWLVQKIIPAGVVLFGEPNYHLFQLALFHTMFNITNTFILAWFIPLLERIATLMVKDSVTGSETSLKMLQGGYQEVSEAYIFEAQEYMKRLFSRVGSMISNFNTLLKEPEMPAGEFYEGQFSLEAEIDQLEEQLASFLSQLSSTELSPKHHNEVSIMIRTVGELERIGDEMLRISKVWKKLAKRELDISDKQRQELRSLFTQLIDLQQVSHSLMITRESSFAETPALEINSHLKQLQKKINKRIRNRLEDGANVRLELMFMDILNAAGEIRDMLITILQFDQEKRAPAG